MTMAATEKSAPVINQKLIIPFVNSVRDVFSTMVNVPTTVERPHFKQAATATYDVSGIIGFSGQITGSVVVTFARDAAVKLVAAFAGLEMPPEDPDFADAIGELANMIAGRAKKDLGASASISVPSVIIGNHYTIARLSDVPCLVIPCRTPVGDFAVEVNIQHNGSAGQ
jgi:chemotaxis protein CheX